MEKEIVSELRINDILNMLPHRYPFLLVDKVQIIEPGVEGIGIKNVTMNEPQFTGHFPENPIMPGVLIMEAMAQTCGVVVKAQTNGGKDGVVLFMGIDEAKFRKPVLPGDVLEMHVVKEKECRGVYRFRCKASCNGVLHAEALLTAMMGK
jgi:3-hydroxyacyl-[acyl-carrier-protein] dehydratase